MRITKVSIDGFGLFDGRFELELPGDIALIVGDNETGKSTILTAIGAILFGLEKDREKAAFAPYGHSAPGSGSLEFETDGKRHRLSRDFASNHAKVELLEPTERVLFDGSAKPAGRSDEKEAYDALVRELIGIESRDVFRNSMMTEQSSLPPKMKNVVRRIVSGSASADYAVVLENLKSVCDDLSMELPWRRGPARKPRRIEVLQKEIQDKKRTLSEAREAGLITGELRSRLRSLDSDMAEAKEGITRQKSWLETLASFAQTLKEKQRLEEQLNEHRNEIRRIEKLEDEIKGCSQRIETEYPQYVCLPEQAEADIANIIRIRESEREFKQRYRQSETDTFPISRALLGRLSLLRMFGGLFMIGFGTLFHGAWRIGIVLCGFLTLICSFLYDLFAWRSHKSARRGKLEEIDRQLETLKSQAETIEERYPLLNENAPDEILKRLREIETIKREKEKKEAALGQYASLEEIESKFNRLSNELVIADSRLEELKSNRPSLSDMEREGRTGSVMEKIDAEIPSLEKKRVELADERENLFHKLATAEAKEMWSEEALEEKIAELESKSERLKHSRDAHIMAVKALDEAVAEFRASHLSRIEKRTTSLLEQITGLQCRVQLDEKLEALGVERDGRLLIPEQLSQGVRDQLHFALRLAAVEEISGDAHLPILLDDPFVNFDESRLKAALEMLDKLCESHQIVLFTHDRRYCDWRKPARLL